MAQLWVPATQWPLSGYLIVKVGLLSSHRSQEQLHGVTGNVTDRVSSTWGSVHTGHTATYKLWAFGIDLGELTVSTS